MAIITMLSVVLFAPGITCFYFFKVKRNGTQENMTQQNYSIRRHSLELPLLSHVISFHLSSYRTIKAFSFPHRSPPWLLDAELWPGNPFQCTIFKDCFNFLKCTLKIKERRGEPEELETRTHLCFMGFKTNVVVSVIDRKSVV